MRFILTFALVLLLSLTAFAQVPLNPAAVNAENLPTASLNTGKVYVVKSPTPGDCSTTGGGSAITWCRSNGSAWVPLGDGLGTGGGAVNSFNGRSGIVLPAAGDYAASDLTSGTLSDARLSANVPLLNAPNVFSSTNQFGFVGIGGTTPESGHTQTAAFLKLSKAGLDLSTDTQNGLYVNLSGGNTPGGEHLTGVYSQVQASSNSVNTGGPIALSGKPTVLSGVTTTLVIGANLETVVVGATGTAYGIFNQVNAGNAGSIITIAYGEYIDLLASGSSPGTIANATGIHLAIRKASAGTITGTVKGLDLSGWSSSPTTSYGIYADSSIDIGSTKYFIYSLSASPSLFTGSLTASNISGTTSGTNTGDQTPASLGLVIGTNVQAWDADLDAIGAIAGTAGLLKKTAANTWSLDTSDYLTGNQTITLSGDVSGSGATAITTTIGGLKVTNGMLAGSIAYSKLVLTGSILNADLAGSIAASKLVGTDIATVGTITAGTWNATVISGLYGGTGQSSYAVGDLLYASGSSALSKLAGVATGNALISGGLTTAPSWGKIGLTTHVSGILPSANGGTGTAFFSASGLTALRAFTFPDADATIARTDTGQTFTGANNFGQLLPALTDTYDLGSATKLWRKGWLSEIDALLFAQNTASVIGGWLVISKNEGLIPVGQDVGTGDTTIDFGQSMTPNDFVQIRAAGAVEYLKVLTLSSGTRYNVTRDLDGSGANAWAAGTVYLVMGNSGNGRVELNANATPRVSVFTQGSTYNAQTEMLRMGDLNGSWNVSSETYGLGVGQYGVAGKSSLRIDDSGIHFYNNITERIRLLSDGSGYLANSAIAWDTSGNLTVTGNAVIGGVTIGSGKMYVGTGTYGNTNTGFYVDSTSQFSLKDKLTWDGTTLTVTGGGTFSGALSAATGTFAGSLTAASGTITGDLNIGTGGDIRSNATAALTGNGYWLAYNAGTPIFRVGTITTGALTKGMYWDGSNLTIKGTNFTLDSSGNLTATNAVITGVITASSGSITGPLTISGASGSLAFGTTPPTSASAGTGLWLDRTGLYGLASNVVQAKFDAVTGTITGGAGSVVLSATGLTMAGGTSSTNQLSWLDAGLNVTAFLGSHTVGTTKFFELTNNSLATNTNSSLRLFSGNSDASTQAIFTMSGNGATSQAYSSFFGQNFLGVIIGTSAAPNAMLDVRGDAVVTGLVKAGSGPTTLTDSTGKILSAALNTVGVPQGGTSLTTLTANNVILGNGTSAPLFVAPGTSGNVLSSNGSTWVSAAPTLSITNTVSSGTTGSVLYVGAGGALSQDNANFFWDGTNHRAGFGTASPQVLVHMQGSSAGARLDVLRLSNTGAGVGTGASVGFSVGTLTVSPAYISSPYVSGTGMALLFATGGGGASANADGTVRLTLDGAGAVRMHAYGAGTATFDASGNITSVSDERMKRDIRPFTRGLPEILNLTPISYGYTVASGLDQTRNDYAGFSAQNVLAHIPEAIGYSPNGMMSLSDRPIIAALVTSVQQLNARIQALEKLLDSQKPALIPIGLTCQERIRQAFLQKCSGGQCARMSVDVITPKDCFHLSAKEREEATKQ